MTIRALFQKLMHGGAAWLLPAWVASVGPLPAAGQDYTFDTNTGSVTITRYHGSGGAVVVPPAINGLPVTAIGDAAFGFDSAITSVTIADSVTNLGQIVFISCTSLTNVFLPASVTGIGELTFKNCFNLAAITVASNNPAFSTASGVLFNKNHTTLVQYPQGKGGEDYIVPARVRTIASGAFYNCGSLTQVALPAGLRNIGDAAFYGCLGLAHALLPEGVTNLGTQAFLNCQSLTQMTIPDSVISLGEEAFNSCGRLTNVIVGNRVTSIASSTFTDCSSLASAVLGRGVTSIGEGAFEYCSALSHLTLGRNLTCIGADAFSYCFSLPAITLPQGLKTIDSGAFQFCSGLTTVNLPASLDTIGDRVFEFCSGLIDFTVDSHNPAYASIDGVLFDRRLARLLQYPVANPRSSYTLPAGTAGVADTAFVSAFNLTSITIPASVTNLETLAFYDCSEVTGFFFEGAPPALGDNVFDLDAAAAVYYLAGTRNWGSTFDGLPTALWDPSAQAAPTRSSLQPFGFNITGVPNTPLVVEASTTLGAGPWMRLACITLTNGQFYFSDSQATNYPGRFYRFRSP